MDMNIWHAWRWSLSPQQPPRSPLPISHTRAVCSAAPGAACLGRAGCALRLASPVSVVEHLVLVLVLLPAGIQSCCFSWVQEHHLSAGGHGPGPTRWDDPWPHSRVVWNSGWEDPWTAQRCVVTEWTCLCHHYTWEYQFICWHRLNPKLHHLHSLIFSLVFPLTPAIPVVLLKVTDKRNSRPFSQSLALWLPGAAKTILCFFLQEASLS